MNVHTLQSLINRTTHHIVIWWLDNYHWLNILLWNLLVWSYHSLIQRLAVKMGANQSSRKITVVNDEATGVIKISDSVVQRLKGITVYLLQLNYLLDREKKSFKNQKPEKINRKKTQINLEPRFFILDFCQPCSYIVRSLT